MGGVPTMWTPGAKGDDMVMTVTQVEPPAVGLNPGLNTLEQADQTARVNLGPLTAAPDPSEKLSNPAAIGDQIVNGLRDLLQQSETINRTLGADFQRALDRVHAREAQAAISAPGMGGLLASGLETASLGGLSGHRGGTSLPGPAELHPGAAGGLEQQWEKLRDEQDRAFIRYNQFAAYQLQSSELQKITEQLSNAVNTLVKAS